MCTILIVSLFISLNICCNMKTVLLSTHNICPGWEITELRLNYAHLSESLIYSNS